MRSGGCSSLLMPLEPLAEVAGRSRSQYTGGRSHPRVATAVRGAHGGCAGWRRRVLVARLVLLLFVEAEADVALQGRRGQPFLGKAALQEGDAGAEVRQSVDPAGDLPSTQQLKPDGTHETQQNKTEKAIISNL